MASQGGRGAMSRAGPASPGRSGAALPLPLPLPLPLHLPLPLPLAGDRKREALSAGALLQPIIKDVGEIYSRLLDHRPVIQGEIRYFVKEFEEKRGLRELRVLENLKSTIFEANENILPKCELSMHDNLNKVLKKLQASNNMIHRLQEREREERKLQADKLMADEENRVAQWESFMKEQQNKQAEVDEEHRKAMERLKEQYSEMEKELDKYISF
ncbi:biogenesis of lysosome-related organelles complex 1 subunit 5 [Cygnus atratus]|uniref:biogenesis of lysosome-related organelles complex 1 subunit 5 n=1 Tax=Cygnus atratus TaxID=8868 RepID=UPI0015D575EC|nr:biogenesis of lysosome-related organelles complex 1 subunit 5 [Cygnus atratus]